MMIETAKNINILLRFQDLAEENTVIFCNKLQLEIHIFYLKIWKQFSVCIYY